MKILKAPTIIMTAKAERKLALTKIPINTKAKTI
jgi:hypothetical protein